MTTALFSLETSTEGFSPSSQFDIFAIALSARLKSYKGVMWFSFFDKLNAPRIKLFTKKVDFCDKVLIQFDNELVAHFCNTSQSHETIPTYFIYEKDNFNSMIDYLISFTSDYHKEQSIVSETNEDHPLHTAETCNQERSVSLLTQSILEELNVIYEFNKAIDIYTDISKLKLPDLKLITEQRGHYSNEYASVIFKGEKIGHVVSEVVKYSGGYEEREYYTTDREKWNEMIKYIISNIKYERKIHFFIDVKEMAEA